MKRMKHHIETLKGTCHSCSEPKTVIAMTNGFYNMNLCYDCGSKHDVRTLLNEKQFCAEVIHDGKVKIPALIPALLKDWRRMWHIQPPWKNRPKETPPEGSEYTKPEEVVVDAPIAKKKSMKDYAKKCQPSKK
jgi:hypothetical protein